VTVPISRPAATRLCARLGDLYPGSEVTVTPRPSGLVVVFTDPPGQTVLVTTGLGQRSAVLEALSALPGDWAGGP
jgi:hypothetical protein